MLFVYVCVFVSRTNNFIMSTERETPTKDKIFCGLLNCWVVWICVPQFEQECSKFLSVLLLVFGSVSEVLSIGRLRL